MNIVQSLSKDVPTVEEYKIMENLVHSDNENENVIAIKNITPQMFESIIRQSLKDDMLLVFKYMDMFAEISKRNGAMKNNLIKYSQLLKTLINILPDEIYDSTRKRIAKYYIIKSADYWMLDYLLSNVVTREYLYDERLFFNIFIKRPDNEVTRIITKIMSYYVMFGGIFNFENILLPDIDLVLMGKFKATNTVLTN